MKKSCVMGAALALLIIAAGCQSLVPASRSNDTRYGTIGPVVKGNNNTVHVTVGDGTVSDASGGGDTQTNTPTQTTETKPEVALGFGGSSVGTGNAKPGGNVLTDAFNKLSGLIGGTSSAKLTKPEADALKGCIDGNCFDD